MKQALHHADPESGQGRSVGPYSVRDRSGQDAVGASIAEKMIGRAVREFIVPSLLLRHMAGRISLINEAARRNAARDELDRVVKSSPNPILSHERENAAGGQPANAMQNVEPISGGISKRDIVDSAMAALACERDTISERWASLRRAGHSPEDLCLNFLSPVAVELGRRWLDDESSFGDVTMAMTVLHKQLHDVYSELEEAVEPVDKSRTILLAPAPGTDHVFGAAMVEQFFRAYGWDVTSGVGASEAELLAKVAGQHFDVVGLSLGSHDSNSNYADLVARIRAASPNKALVVMAGGAPFINQPELAEKLGADATAPDARRAVLWARRLVVHKTDT
ncbi:MAG: cobalamin-dependent protein [Pseudomonadota bacterium]